MSKSIKLIVNYLLGPLLFIILSYVIYKQIINQHDLAIRWEEIKRSWNDPLLSAAIILMFLNWGIEAIKMKFLLRHLEAITFLKSLKCVFAGCSITMLTPNRTGEFGGRILFLKQENRVKAISINIIGSIAQLIITMVLGCLSSYYFLFCVEENHLKSFSFLTNTVLLLGIFACIILFYLYFRIKYFLKIVNKIKTVKKWIKYIEVIGDYSTKELLTVLIYSLFRYTVFILQYIFILKVMHVDIETSTSILLMMLFYFIMALAPTIGFTELPVRASLSLVLFGAYATNVFGIQVATFSIWIINLLIPAIIGTLIISSFRRLSKNETHENN